MSPAQLTSYLKTFFRWTSGPTISFGIVFGVHTQSRAVDFSFSNETYLAARTNPKSSTTINSDNRTFQLTTNDTSVDLRPELKITFNNRFANDSKLILRPRWILKTENTAYNSPDESKNTSQGNLQLSDLYLENIWSDQIKTTSGLQVYQWGPAELLNPSNPLFHFNNNQKSAFFKEKGQVLLRVNIDYNRNWSQVFIIEPISNNEPAWIATNTTDNTSENFYPKGLLRTEWNSSQGLNSASLVFGKEERQKNFLGETITYSPLEGVSVYLDAKQDESPLAFVPTVNNYGGDSLGSNTQSSLSQLAIYGIRLEDSNYDLRLEVVDNQAGWDKNQWTRVVKLLKTASPDLALNYSCFAKSGLELFSQRYYYFSLRLPNLGKKQDKNLAFRYLLSDLDGSSSLQTSLDWNASDSLTGFFEAVIPFGSTETDLNFTGQSTYLLGLKWNI